MKDTAPASDLRAVLAEALADEEAGWSMSSFGVIAEFHHVRGDPPPTVGGDALEIVTGRGGLRLDALGRPLAWEALSPKPHRWMQAMALLLPEAEAVMNRRAVLTELGPDAGALRARDRGAVLFDMGLAQLQVDFCIRTSDPGLLDTLHAAAGRSLLEPGNPAMPAILAAHPHRVALTRLGRFEVFQKIGGPDTGGTSPEGPHTHVLPKLMRAGRTHSANAPIPDGWVPCATLHPGNPVIDRMGRDRPYDAGLADRFGRLMDAWGQPEQRRARDDAATALAAGVLAEAFPEPETRAGRAGLRCAVRRWRHMHPGAAQDWAARFDRGGDVDEEAPGH